MRRTQPPPFKLEVFDKDFNFKGTIGNPRSVRVNVRHNVKGLATIALAADHHRVKDLMEDGSRLRITAPDLPDPHLLSGFIQNIRGEGPRVTSVLTFTVHDDFRLFHNTLGWPRPLAAINDQGAGGVEYDKQTGPVETVVKHYVQANAVQRLGRPLVVAPDQGRGPTISASLRMHPLYDRLFPVVDGAGVDGTNIGWTVRQQVATYQGVERECLVVDCYEGATVPRVLSEESGVIRKWSFVRDAPTATRVVVGGQGEGYLRSWRALQDLVREAQWGDVLEVVKDARDEEDPSLLTKRGQEVLDDGQPTTGLSVELSDTATFRYGRVAKVGDLVTLRVGIGIEVGPEKLSEVALGWTASDGFTTTPTVGDIENNPSRKMAGVIQNIARSLRRRDLER